MWETWGMLMAVVCCLYMCECFWAGGVLGELTHLARVTLAHMCPPRKTCMCLSHWDLHIRLYPHTPLGLCFMHLQLSTQSVPDVLPDMRHSACPMMWRGTALHRNKDCYWMAWVYVPFMNVCGIVPFCHVLQGVWWSPSPQDLGQMGAADTGFDLQWLLTQKPEEWGDFMQIGVRR